MAGRYLVTGVQLALLNGLQDAKEVKKMIDEIIDNQFICNTDNTDVIKDAKMMHEFFDYINQMRQ